MDAARAAGENAARLIAELGPMHPDALAARGEHALAVAGSASPAEGLAMLEELLADQRRALPSGHPDILRTRFFLADITGHAEGAEAGVRLFDELASDVDAAVSAADEGAADEGAVDEGAADEGAVDGRPAADGATDSEGAGGQGADGQGVGGVTADATDEDAAAMMVHLGRTIHERRAMMLGMAGRPEDSAAAYARLIERMREDPAVAASDMLILRNRHANAVGDAGDPAAAVSLLEETLRDVRRALGEDHEYVQYTETYLANWLMEAGRTEEAIERTRAILGVRTERLGAQDPATSSSRQSLAAMLTHAGRTEEALALIEPEVERLTAEHGSAHPLTRSAASLLGVVRTAAGS